MDMPDILDISHLRGTGKQPHEDELADVAPSAAPGAFLQSHVADFLCLSLLFSEDSLYAISMSYRLCNSNIKNVQQFVFTSLSFVCLIAINVDEAVISQLVDMGFPRNACVKGVYFSNNTGVEAAMNWIVEHMDDPGQFT